MNNASVVSCSSNFRCWECENDCTVKQSFSLPEELFMYILHESYSIDVGFLMTVNNLSSRDAEQMVQINFMSLITARMKFLQMQKN